MFSSDELPNTCSRDTKCNIEIILLSITSYSGESSSILYKCSKDASPFPSITEFNNEINKELSMVPNNFFTLLASSSPFP